MTSHASSTGDEENSQEEESALQVLLRLGSTARLCRSGDGGLHAQVPVGDRHEIHGVKSDGFRDWLIDGYFAERGEPASVAAIARVVGLLEARARFGGGEPSVFIRVGGGSDSKGSAHFLDLGDSSGAAIRICAGGWEVVHRPEIKFQRPEGLLPLPVPERGGSIELLRPYVNVTDDGFRLLIAWITAALRPVGPYPILSLHGEQGSAKSTLARIVGLLIDPQACPLLGDPGSARDLMATAVNGWLLAYDNLTAIPDWLSDSLCRLVYGAGLASRALFSERSCSRTHSQRPVLVNGIEDFMQKSDLVDRTVFLHLPSISQNRRRDEEEFWSGFRAEHAQIFGAVLDALVAGLRERPSVRLARLPRMADFALWGEAVCRGLCWAPGEFASAYEDSRRTATETSLGSSPLGTVLLELATSILNWETSPSELFRILTEKVGKRVARSAGWPKTLRSFGNELRRLAPQLRMHGLSISFSKGRDSQLVTLVTVAFLAGVGAIGDPGCPN
jgi:hypothetical protein